MSEMGFQRKSLDGGWVGGWGELYPSLFGFLEFVLSLQSPLAQDVIAAIISVNVNSFQFASF